MADWAEEKAIELLKRERLSKNLNVDWLSEALREAEWRGADRIISGEARSGRATLAHNAERSRGGDSDRLDDARGLEQSCKPHRWLKVAAGTDGQERCSECGSSRTPVKTTSKEIK